MALLSGWSRDSPWDRRLSSVSTTGSRFRCHILSGTGCHLTGRSSSTTSSVIGRTDEDHTYVDFVRDGSYGNAAARSGDSHWRRITELRVRSAKSVFQFDVQGSVAKSTHAGLPWLRYLRQHVGCRVHFWPFDGWNVLGNSSVIAEVYPSLWSRTFPSAGRTSDQHDAFATAEWLRRADTDGTLIRLLCPELESPERKAAEVEGWILGVA